MTKCPGGRSFPRTVDSLAGGIDRIRYFESRVDWVVPRCSRPQKATYCVGFFSFLAAWYPALIASVSDMYLPFFVLP